MPLVSLPSRPLRVAKTETFDPAFQGWWKADQVIVAQDASPNLLVDAGVAARRQELLRLTTGFRQQQQQQEREPAASPPRVTSAEGPASAGGGVGQLKRQRLAAAQWGLDRIDARSPSLDRAYAYNDSRAGEGVTIYTIDSGIIAEHDEFACDGHASASTERGGCSRAEAGPTFLSEGAGHEGGGDGGPPTSRDCDGHGTHVASTAIGRRVGVAKGARVVALRVLDCNGTGIIEDVISALEYVRANAKKPAVVTLSLGVPAGEWSAPLERAVRSAILEKGVTVVVASGNSGVDACGVSPARVPEALTVAATDLEGKFGNAVLGGGGGQGPGGDEDDDDDVAVVGGPRPRVVARRAATALRDTVYKYSNTGPCVDVLAPGVDILAACGGARRCGRVAPDAYAWASGTSMSVPHVAGLAAIYLGAHPDASPDEVRAALVGSATRGALSGAGGGEEGGVAGGNGAWAGGLRSREAATRAAGGGIGESNGFVLNQTPDLQIYSRVVAGADE